MGDMESDMESYRASFWVMKSPPEVILSLVLNWFKRIGLKVDCDDGCTIL